MPERHVTPNSDRDVAHLNADRTLEQCKDRYPVIPFCFCSNILKPRSHVERHHVRSVPRFHTLQVRAANRLRQLVDLRSNFGLVNCVLCSHAQSFHSCGLPAADCWFTASRDEIAGSAVTPAPVTGRTP